MKTYQNSDSTQVVEVEKSVVEYWGIEDFDQDGKADDEYYSYVDY
eukprot:gene35518-43789_t